jgi:hypothetical protein
LNKKYLAIGSVTLIASGSMLGASAAQAVSLSDCGTHAGADVVAVVGGNICSVVYSTAGSFEFTAAAGITQLEAIVIGGGGSSYQDASGYAGGGGEVVYISSLSPATTHNFEVGAGGSFVAIPGSNGQPSSLGTVVANGGFSSVYNQDPASTDSGMSGSDMRGFGTDAGAGDRFPIWGGGAKTAAALDTPGSGFLPSDSAVTLGSALFPVVVGEPELGRGGDGNASELPTMSMGWGGSVVPAGGQAGADGGVIFRFAAPVAELADTGQGFATRAQGMIALALLVAGSVGLVITRRRKTV